MVGPRLGEKSRCLAQDLIATAKLTVPALQRLEPLALLAAQPGTSTFVALCLASHLRNVSAVQPIFSAIAPIAAHWDWYSPSCSKTMGTARSRTSGEYLFDVLMTPSSQSLESPGIPGRPLDSILKGRIRFILRGQRSELWNESSDGLLCCNSFCVIELGEWSYRYLPGSNVADRRFETRELRMLAHLPVAAALSGARFTAQLPFFLRRPIAVDVARQTLRTRLENRVSDFESFIETAIYRDPMSPYLALLRLVGCEHGDFVRLIESNGVEGSLKILARQGVYLSIDEFKGRKPVVRGSAVLNVDPLRLAGSASPSQLTLHSGGSRGTETPVPIDLAYVRDRAVSSCMTFAARGGLGWVHGLWGGWGRASMVVLLELSAFGSYPAFWFSQVDPDTPRMSPLYRWSAYAIRLSTLLAGIRPPKVRYVPIDRSLELARWMAETRHKGGIPHLHTHASSVVRICEEANAAGLDIHGAQFTAASEPMTEARMAVIRKTGARAWPQYASVESGVIGLACLNATKADDVHLLNDRFAVIQSEADTDLPDGSLLVSSLRRTSSPLVLLNVSFGDQATLEKRNCGCAMERLGWSTHLDTIRSQEKLTAGGTNFLNRDIIHVLEEVLPTRCGGGPMDYQLLEEISGDGRSRLRLLVNPSLGRIDSSDVRETFIKAIGGFSDSSYHVSRMWHENDILTVERIAPRKTGAGKILHIHQQSAD